MYAQSKTLLLGLALFISQAAYADMWVYTDAQGVKHFASSQLDKRYGLLFRSSPAISTDTAENAGGAQPNERTPDYSAKSIAAMEVAPGFIAVKEHLRTAADTHQLDMALLRAVIHTESRFNPNAVSPKGAVGLMQVMPATAERYGVANDQRGTVSAKLTDPKTNIQTGARYLRDLIKMFPGQLELAVAAYNAGEGAVQRAGNKIPNYKETQNYVRSVMQLYRSLNPQANLATDTTTEGRVKGQFLGANTNLNLRWGVQAGHQATESQAKRKWRDPAHTHDLVIGSGQVARAPLSLTELSN